jgi:hypothetical protein
MSWRLRARPEIAWARLAGGFFAGSLEVGHIAKRDIPPSTGMTVPVM